MNLKIVWLDETEYWNDEERALHGRIMGAYVYDPNEKTCLCSPVPCYYLVFVGNVPERDVDGEAEIHWIGEDCYHRVSDIDALPSVDYDASEVWEEYQEDNSYWFWNMVRDRISCDGEHGDLSLARHWFGDDDLHEAQVG